MASKRQKKDKAKQLIGDLIPSIPPVGPLAVPSRVLRIAENIAQSLVESDPLGLITSDEALMTIANDDNVVLSADMVKMINDPEMRLMSNGDIVRKTGRDIIRESGQFSRANLVSRLPTGVSPARKTRKKTNTDKKMSKALRLANEKFRKKNGQLRKGATQAQIMRYAHKLLKQM